MAYSAALQTVLGIGGGLAKYFTSENPYDQYINSLEDIKDMPYPELSYRPVSASANEAFDLNRQNFPRIRRLGNRYNDLLQDQTFGLYSRLDPNFLNTQQAEGRNIYDLSRGVLPQDVTDSIFRNNAEKFIGVGTPGTGLASSGTARDLGLTSLDLIGRGAAMNTNAVQRWQSLANRQFDPSAFLFTPAQLVSLDDSRTNSIFQRNLGQYGAQSGIESALGQARLGSTSFDNEQMAALIDSITGAASGGVGGFLGGMGGGGAKPPSGAGGFSSMGGAQSAAPYTNVFSSNNFGYVPVAQLA